MISAETALLYVRDYLFESVYRVLRQLVDSALFRLARFDELHAVVHSVDELLLVVRVAEVGDEALYLHYLHSGDFVERLPLRVVLDYLLDYLKRELLRYLLVHEEAGVDDVAGHAVLKERAEARVVHLERIGAERVRVALDDEGVGVDSGGEALRGGALRRERRAHDGGERRAGELHDRRERRVLHEPAYRVERLVDSVYSVRRPELRLDRAAVAVAHVFADDDRLAVLRRRHAAVLEREQIFVVGAAERIVLHLVEVGRLERDGVLILDVDDERVVVQDGDVVLAAVLRVRDGGLAGAGESEHREDELLIASVLERVALEPAVAGCVAVARRDAPAEGQRALLVFAEVAHAEDGGAVLLWREEGEAERIIGVRPVRVGEDVDVAVVRERARLLVALRVLFVDVLEVEHPAVKVVLKALGDHEMGLDHKVLVEPDDGLGAVVFAEARVVDGFAQERRHLRDVDVRLADYAARRGAASVDRSVVEEKDVGPFRQSELDRLVDRHTGKLNRPRAVLRQLVGLFQVLDAADVVPVESGLYRRSDRDRVETLKAVEIHKMFLSRHAMSLLICPGRLYPHREKRNKLTNRQCLRNISVAYTNICN